MLDTTIVVVAIGLVWLFASVSLIVSQINEGISSLLGSRSKALGRAIGELVNDPKVAGWALQLLNHALVNPQGSGMAKSLADLKDMPSYIPPDHFATALLDGIRGQPGATGELRDDIARIEDAQLRTLLQGIYAKTQGDVVKIRGELAAWFGNSMDRASGAYKRRTQLACFCIGLVIAIVFNVDSIHVFRALWSLPVLMSELSAGTPPATASAAMTVLQQLPIGWSGNPSFDWSAAGAFDAATKAFGWILTALSVLFGAPFWFDLLQKIVQLRSTGPKPKES